jgi:hypothetical protein
MTNSEHRLVRQGVDKRAARARELMADKYEKRHQGPSLRLRTFVRFRCLKKTILLALQLSDCSVRLSDERAIDMSSRRSKASSCRTMQPKTSMLSIRLLLSSITARLGTIEGKIMLRHAAKAGHTSSKRKIFCGCAGSCQSARCVCYKAGVQCIIYCHQRTSDHLNIATGTIYNQVAIVNELEQQDEEEQR